MSERAGLFARDVTAGVGVGVKRVDVIPNEVFQKVQWPIKGFNLLKQDTDFIVLT